MDTRRTIQIVTPIGRLLREPKIPLAPRPSTLEGKTVGLLSNGKMGAMPLMRAIGDLLKKQYGVSQIVEEERLEQQSHKVAKRAKFTIDDAMERLLRGSDAVVNGVGD